MIFFKGVEHNSETQIPPNTIIICYCEILRSKHSISCREEVKDVYKLMKGNLFKQWKIDFLKGLFKGW